MTGRTSVRAIYCEHDLDQEPFAWLKGQVRRDAAGRAEVLRLLGRIVGLAGRSAERPGTRALRHQDQALLVEGTIDATDHRGRRVRVTVVLRGPLHRDDLAACARVVAAELTGAGLTGADPVVTEGGVRRDLEWGLASTASRFRRLARAVAQALHAARAHFTRQRLGESG